MRFFFSIFLFFPFTLVAQNQDTASVFFEFDRSDFDVEAPPGVGLMNQMVEEGIFEIVSLRAYCDTTGSEAYNKRLAKKRLQAVEEELGSYGRKLLREIIGEGYTVGQGYRSSDFRRVDIIYVFHEETDVTEPIVETKPEKSDLVKSFEGFLKDTSSMETMIRLDVHFHPGMDVLLPESEPELWSLFDFLHYNEDVTAFIRGHVCCSDDMPLSIARAQVVYNFLVERSISAKRLSYKGFSNSMPAVTPEVTEEDRIMNRRVDVVFTKNK